MVSGGVIGVRDDWDDVGEDVVIRWCFFSGCGINGCNVRGICEVGDGLL